ncbi:MAG: VOC family protein [Ancalomicrobiaceae bacterium]|nr:VOC family protein [Ancalomicrobiaceae bacterium]
MTTRQSLGLMTYLVRDTDEAIGWFVEKLGFDLIEDSPQGDGKRWVVVRPKGGGVTGAALLLAKAVTPEQEAAIGNQSGGRVFLFLTTDDFDRDHAAMLAAGITFREAPRDEPYGKVAVFEDLYGQGWDLIEPKMAG